MKNSAYVYFKYVTSALFYFPAVVLHEALHAIAAKMTMATIHHISLVPRLKKLDDGTHEITYGYVRATPKIEVLHLFVAIAPALLWLLLYYLLYYMDILRIDIQLSVLSVHFDYYKLIMNDPWLIYVSMQLFWGGFLSRADVKVMFGSLISVSGVLSVITAVLTIKGFNEF